MYGSPLFYCEPTFVFEENTRSLGLFFLWEKVRAGWVESLRKVDGLVVDILTLVADKFLAILKGA